ncbi:alpha/beta hydrolase [Roseovarius sp. S1116L3]|uniref:alpha/beta hydrolase n=1 Tax=Roseovarius roseus TaxID=3342636 RepID=UPI00372B0CC1
MGRHRGEAGGHRRVSLRARLLNGWLRQTEKRILARAERPEVLRRHMEHSARLFLRPPRGVAISTTALGAEQIPALRIMPCGASEGPMILYLHGGGYLFGSPRVYRALASHLALETGLQVIMPQYRLAPEHPFPAAPEDALAAYRAVMDHPGGVILGGDSAGGGLALALLAQIFALGLPQPRGTFCFSPLTDLTFSGASFAFNAGADALLPAHRAAEMAQMYLQGAPASDTRASPLFGDFTGAAPVWMTVGSTEILLDDARRMANRLLNQRVDVTCVIEQDLPHVWPMFHALIPEAHQTLAKLGSWIRSLSRP